MTRTFAILVLISHSLACAGAPPGYLLPDDHEAYQQAASLRYDWQTRDDLPECRQSWQRLEIRIVPADEWTDTLGGRPCGEYEPPCTQGLAVRWVGTPIIFLASDEAPIHVVRHEMAHLMASCSGSRDPDHENPAIWNQPDGVVWMYETNVTQPNL